MKNFLRILWARFRSKYILNIHSRGRSKLNSSTSPTPKSSTISTQLAISTPSLNALSGKTSGIHSRIVRLPYEILEAILLSLPPLDVLLAQRVCRVLRDVVLSSHPIRRMLFFEPAHASGQVVNWDFLKWNPFLETRLFRLLDIRVIGVHRSGPKGPVKMIAHVRLRDPILTEKDWLHTALDERASWRQMLVTQPPATLMMHPSASLFWKSEMEDEAQFSHCSDGFKIIDIISAQ